MLHLLSATGPVPHAVQILASLVVDSKQFTSVSVGSNYKFELLSCVFVHSDSK